MDFIRVSNLPQTVFFIFRYSVAGFIFSSRAAFHHVEISGMEKCLLVPDTACRHDHNGYGTRVPDI